ncbi:MAG TPA: hypothetical protein VJH03_07075 [Blastocatellia bacterium]|nr:hypothetical protein [Blastocatellia bacterium]
MLTVQESAKAKAVGANGCHECGGTGLVQYWSEFSYFEDRRRCTQCEAGQRLGSVIAKIIARVKTEDHALSR